MNVRLHVDSALPDRTEHLTAVSAGCRLCPALVESRTCVLAGEGSADPVVVFVADQPTRLDDFGGVPLLDRAGTLLRSMASEAGLPPSLTYFTAAVRCRTPRDRVPTEDELSACSGWLSEELSFRTPLAVVSLGRYASRALSLIVDELGGTRVFHLDPPDKALRDKRKRASYLAQLKAVAAYVRGEDVPENAIPDPWEEGEPNHDSPWVAVDTEGDSLEEDRAEKVVCYQLSDGQTSQLIFPSDWKRPQHVFAHNIKYDAPILGLDLSDLAAWDDTLLMAYVLRETPLGLKQLGPKLTGLEMGSIKPLLTRRVYEDKDVKLTRRGLPAGRENVEIFWEPGDTTYTRRTWTTEPRTFSEALTEVPEQAREYALLDAVVTARLARSLTERLRAEPRLWSYYHEIEKPVVPIVYSMETAGVEVDPRVLGDLSLDLDRAIAEYEEVAKLTLEVPDDFNLNSTEQLGAALQRLGVKLHKETASGKKSVDKQTLLSALNLLTLEELDDLEVGHDQAAAALSAILRHRQHVKLKSTYVETLLQQRDANGRVHGSFNQTVTDTNRFSSSNPNLQNIPSRTRIGQRIRRAFVARRGHRLVRADFSNLELRIYAHYTDDNVLRSVFESGGDAHSANAVRMLGSDRVEHRKRAKNGIFCRVYGGSDEKFLSVVGIPAREGKAFLTRLSDEMPGLVFWPRWIEQELIQNGYVETLFGWRNYYDHYWSPLPHERSAALREAGNMPIQGTASGIVKLFMIQQHELAQRYDAQIVLQVHDETVTEVPEGAVKEYLEATRRIGREIGAQYLSVPLEVGIDVGPSWGEAEKWH